MNRKMSSRARTRMYAYAPLALVLLVSALSSCAGKPERDYWPTESWRRASPESVGFDSEKLLAALRSQDLAAIGLDSLIVIRNGYIVAEAYRYPNAPDTPHNVNSVTKSCVSTVFGIARDRGLVGNSGKRVLDFFPEYAEHETDARKKRLTTGDVLTMRTGQNWNENTTPNMVNSMDAMIASDNWLTYVLDTPMMMPGGVAFDYNTGASHILTSILQRVTGDAEGFAREALFEPIGISGYRWKKDPQGIPAGGYGLSLKSEDMARLGFLMLNGGLWDSRRIVSEKWVREATKAHTTTRGSFNSSWEYGYQWWIDPSRRSFSAQGYAGQYIFVVPDIDLVVVTTANADFSRTHEVMGLAMGALPGAIVSNGALPENEKAARELADFCASLGQPPEPKDVTLPARYSRAALATPARIAFEPNEAGLVTGTLARADDGSLAFGYEFAGKDGSRIRVSLIAGTDGRFRTSETALPEAWYQFGFEKIPVACRVIKSEGDSVAIETVVTGSTVGPYVDWITLEGDRVTVSRTERRSRQATVAKGTVVR